ncbi:MAG: hypothetical protein Q8K60_08535, partial [Parachlamydiaceae bacterium]|nr:hypothetical protein [Parachlamydiaceae bacterium]
SKVVNLAVNKDEKIKNVDFLNLIQLFHELNYPRIEFSKSLNNNNYYINSINTTVTNNFFVDLINANYFRKKNDKQFELATYIGFFNFERPTIVHLNLTKSVKEKALLDTINKYLQYPAEEPSSIINETYQYNIYMCINCVKELENLNRIKSLKNFIPIYKKIIDACFIFPINNQIKSNILLELLFLLTNNESTNNNQKSTQIWLENRKTILAYFLKKQEEFLMSILKDINNEDIFFVFINHTKSRIKILTIIIELIEAKIPNYFKFHMNEIMKLLYTVKIIELRKFKMNCPVSKNDIDYLSSYELILNFIKLIKPKSNNPDQRELNQLKINLFHELIEEFLNEVNPTNQKSIWSIIECILVTELKLNYFFIQNDNSQKLLLTENLKNKFCTLENNIRLNYELIINFFYTTKNNDDYLISLNNFYHDLLVNCNMNNTQTYINTLFCFLFNLKHRFTDENINEKTKAQLLILDMVHETFKAKIFPTELMSSDEFQWFKENNFNAVFQIVFIHATCLRENSYDLSKFYEILTTFIPGFTSWMKMHKKIYYAKLLSELLYKGSFGEKNQGAILKLWIDGLNEIINDFNKNNFLIDIKELGYSPDTELSITDN